MKTRLAFLTLNFVAVSCVFVACAGDNSNNRRVTVTPKQAAEKNTSKFFYEFKGNDGCSTGLQRPSTKEEMCSALTNKIANKNNCAEDKRREKFLNECKPLEWVVTEKPLTTRAVKMSCSGSLSANGTTVQLSSKSVSWDGKSDLKNTLMTLSEAKDLAEVQLDFFVPEVVGSDGRYKLTVVEGSAKKSLFVIGTTNYPTTLDHYDTKEGSLKVELTCRPENRKSLAVSNVDIKCEGKSVADNDKPVGSFEKTFEWNGKDKKVIDLALEDNGKKVDVKQTGTLKLILDVVEQRRTMQIHAEKIDETANVKVSTAGHQLAFSHTSKEKKSNVQMRCSETRKEKKD